MEDGADEIDNDSESALKAECFLQTNLLEVGNKIVQDENNVKVTAPKYLHKFRTAVLVVQVIRNLIKIYRDYALSRTEPISFSEYAAFETDTDSLLFDRSYFKAKLEMVLTSEAQFILSSPPDKRTSEDVKLAMLSLRATVNTFAGYPVHIQEQLAKVGWYECFGPGRVIIRQGHVPQNFYLILSGTTVVTKVSSSKKTGEHFSKTVAFLKKGKYFGDVAILTNAKRNATVVCHDNVSLLAIARQDFLNIFLHNDSQEGPEYIQLLQNIDLLTGWPIHKLPYNNPRICLHTFYRQGTVITRDSKASSKIYVVKTLSP
ncbi:cyclic nucleotide-binding domain-containing protein 2-like [Discoglossus pictus]